MSPYSFSLTSEFPASFVLTITLLSLAVKSLNTLSFAVFQVHNHLKYLNCKPKSTRFYTLKLYWSIILCTLVMNLSTRNLFYFPIFLNRSPRWCRHLVNRHLFNDISTWKSIPSSLNTVFVALIVYEISTISLYRLSLLARNQWKDSYQKFTEYQNCRYGEYHLLRFYYIKNSQSTKTYMNCTPPAA